MVNMIELSRRFDLQTKAMKTAEDRQMFKDTMLSIGVEVPRSGYAPTLEQADAWRLWMTTVFMPLNVQMRDAVVAR